MRSEPHVVVVLNSAVNGDSLEPPVGQKFFHALEIITQEASFLHMGAYVFPGAHLDDYYLLSGLGADHLNCHNYVRGYELLINIVVRQR